MASRPTIESKCCKCLIGYGRNVIINGLNINQTTVGAKDISDTPHLAFYSKDGKIMKANSAEWRDYLEDIEN